MCYNAHVPHFLNYWWTLGLAAINMDVSLSLWNPDLQSSECIPRSVTARWHTYTGVLGFRTLHTECHSGHTDYPPISHVQGLLTSLYLSFAWDRVSHSVAQADLKLLPPCLSSSRATYVSHHTRLFICFLDDSHFDWGEIKSRQL